jgi:hypothetical protein
MREHFVVSSIRSREVAPAGRSGVRQDEDALKALDFENSLLSASMPSQYPTWLWQSSNGGHLPFVPARTFRCRAGMSFPNVLCFAQVVRRVPFEAGEDGYSE